MNIKDFLPKKDGETPGPPGDASEHPFFPMDAIPTATSPVIESSLPLFDQYRRYYKEQQRIVNDYKYLLNWWDRIRFWFTKTYWASDIGEDQILIIGMKIFKGNVYVVEENFTTGWKNYNETKHTNTIKRNIISNS